MVLWKWYEDTGSPVQIAMLIRIRLSSWFRKDYYYVGTIIRDFGSWEISEFKAMKLLTDSQDCSSGGCKQ